MTAPAESPPSKPSSVQRAGSGLNDDDLPVAAGESSSPRPAASAGEDLGRIGILGWLALLALLLLLGMLFGAALWLYAGYAALGMLLINRILARAWSRQATAVRAVGVLEVEIGAVVPIEIEVRNQGPLPIVWLLAEDLLPLDALRHAPPALGIEGERLQVFLLRPGQSRFLRYRLRCNRRGYFQIGPTVLETGDLMGLHRRYRVGAAPQFLTVMPNIVTMGGFDVASKRPLGEVRIRERILEDPARLQGIRQWQPGDAMRQVHWAATARTGTLHSKIYEQTSVVGATLVLDLHSSTNPAKHEPMRSDLAITLAASIAAALYEMNQPLGLVSNGRDAADRVRQQGWAGDYRTRAIAQQQAAMRSRDDRLRPVVVPARRGPAVFHEIQCQLARLERTDGLPLASLLIESESRLARDTTLLVILQQCSDESAVSLLGLARRGWAVSVIISIFDELEFSTVAGPLIAAGISVMHLKDAQSVPDVCRQATLR